MLIDCLKQLGKGISSVDRAELEKSFKEHQGKGLSEYDASMAALGDFHKGLFDDINELRRSVRLQSAEYKPLSVAKTPEAAPPATVTTPEAAPTPQTQPPGQVPTAEGAEGAPAERTTAAYKAKIDAERAARGAEMLPWSPETKKDTDLLAGAIARHKAKPNEAPDLIAALLKKPRIVSDEQTVQMDVYKQDLANQHNELLKEISQTTDPRKLQDLTDQLETKEQQFDDADKAWRATGTEKGRSLRAQRITLNDNYDLLPMKARMKAATGETKLPPEVEKQIEEQQKTIARLEKRYKAAVAANEQKGTVEKFVREQKVQLRQRGVRRSSEDIRAERADLKSQIAKLSGYKSVGQFITSTEGSFDPTKAPEMTRLIGKLARGYIEEGLTKADEITRSIHDYLKDATDLTHREVEELLTNYGRTRESTPDPLDKKLNEVKSIVASGLGKADVLEKMIRPKRRGSTPDKPTEDQRRALRDMQDVVREHMGALGEQPYDVKTEQATPLDKAIQTAKNRGEQLRKWLAEGKKEVRRRQQVIPNDELLRIKAENEGLEKAVALLEDPAADQKAVEQRLKTLNELIGKAKTAVQTGAVEARGPKEGAKSIWTPEIGAAERERDVLNRVKLDMQREAARKGRETEAAKPTGLYGITDTWADFEKQARKTLTTWNRLADKSAEYGRRGTARTEAEAEVNKIRDATKDPQAQQAQVDAAIKKIAEKNKVDAAQLRRDVLFEPRAKPVQPYDAHTEELRLEMNREKRKYDQQVAIAQAKKVWAERSRLSKAGAYGAAFTRASVLSGVKTIGKIGSALVQRTGQQYAEEGFAKGLKHLAPDTAAKAIRYGGRMNIASEKAAARGFIAGGKEIPRIIATGKSELSERMGESHPGIPTKLGQWLEVPGRFHYGEKNPLLRAEFERSKELLLQQADRISPGSRNNPSVIDTAEEQAFKNAKEVILMGDNPFSRMFVDAQRRMGVNAKDLIRTITPVQRVAANYLNQMVSEYGIGILRGTVRAFREKQPGVLENLTHEEADKTMRLLQRGSLGVLYAVVAGAAGAGAIGGLKLGGYYKRGRKDEVKPNDIKVGNFIIPHVALHSAPDELGQLAATFAQEWQEGKAQDKDASQRLWSGAARGIMGVSEQVPFFNEVTRINDSLRSGDSLADWAGRFATSRVEPQIMQDLARFTDKQETEAVKRRPKGMFQNLLMGVPGKYGRGSIPLSVAPLYKGATERTPTTDELQDLGYFPKGAVIRPDETKADFQKREKIENPLVKRTLDTAIRSSDYRHMSRADKLEYLKAARKSAAENAEKKLEERYPALEDKRKERAEKQKEKREAHPLPEIP